MPFDSANFDFHPPIVVPPKPERKPERPKGLSAYQELLLLSIAYREDPFLNEVLDPFGRIENLGIQIPGMIPDFSIHPQNKIYFFEFVLELTESMQERFSQRLKAVFLTENPNLQTRLKRVFDSPETAISRARERVFTVLSDKKIQATLSAGSVLPPRGRTGPNPGY